MQLEPTKLDEVIQAAFDRAMSAGKDSRRWQVAIAKAKGELESNPYIHFTGASLLILSASGEIYEANGVCQCKAFANCQPCYHRAAYKIVKRYHERGH